ncbi:cell division protein FtsI (penicillin-binding protein 3) [Allopseudospirillum japonicum]|uniref:Peptidoglycan D,D-transpeptidase FtsI n=1 Tax=Allopseudospirillum japonicum TaxID=64971 RepID=A0A1H6QGK0_9GAMM|nr:penicillin-binding transpeptidase domain-containing protein [Allopseudospirillum japonicum]SEI40114.1 cell division protein FtsI (penicillin-binding protein 3) [Allopseudospirillum japonicum]
MIKASTSASQHASSKRDAALNSQKFTYPWRWYLLLSLLALAAVLLGWRLLDLQIFSRDFLQTQGDARTLRNEPIMALRGMITDRHGEPLAVSTPVVTLWTNPQQLPQDERVIRALAQSLQVPYQELSERLALYQGKEFMYLRRQLTPSEAKAVMALEIPGVYAQDEFRRYYPAGEVTAHLVGFNDVDDQGQEGIELAYNRLLTGIPGEKRVLKDRKGRVVRDLYTLSEPRPGKNITLSIDLRLQYLAYRELKAAVSQHKAKSGSLVMLDARTGEVLALVSQPSYNPNNRAQLDAEGLRNRALTDQIEPGSIVKPITVAAAMRTGMYQTETLVNTSPGYMTLNRRTIRDLRNYGNMPVHKIITKSSNIGVARMALSLSDPDTVWQLMYELGFGQSVGTGFPGEGLGKLPHPPKWRPIQLATLSYGYGFTVTPLQAAQAYTALSGHGNKYPVTLFKQEKQPQGVPVLPPKISRSVLEMMETVTHSGGTGTRARIPGYRVAGKTGTTHKVGEEGYTDDYRAIFAGIAPVSDPRLIAVVVVDSPAGQEYYGGLVAAPVFSRVVGSSLRLLNVPPDDPETLTTTFEP